MSIRQRAARRLAVIGTGLDGKGLYFSHDMKAGIRRCPLFIMCLVFIVIKPEKSHNKAQGFFRQARNRFSAVPVVVQALKR